MAQMIRQNEPCPICQMPVKTDGAQYVEKREGRLYFFCAPGCRDKFLAQGGHPKPKGRWGRFLDRLARANAKEFGTSGPSCCH